MSASLGSTSLGKCTGLYHKSTEIERVNYICIMDNIKLLAFVMLMNAPSKSIRHGKQ